jgi:hypothetical protein
MPRLVLEQVTLCAVDTRAPGLAVQSLQRSMAGIDFARVLLFTHGFAPVAPPPGIAIIDIGPIDSGAAYSGFVLRRLPAYVETSHVLVTQWDGFVVHPKAWRSEFLQWDYIGAVWDDQPEGCSVGNGGFSLRSQRLLQAGRDPRIVDVHPEDEMLCRTHRAWLQDEFGVRFAPPALARCFAFENERPRAPTFGFHGPSNLPRFVDEPTLGRWLDALPDAFFRGRDARRLARSLIRRGMAPLASRLIERRVAAGMKDGKTRTLALVARCLGAVVARARGGL